MRNDDDFANLRELFCRIFCPCKHREVVREVAYSFKGIIFKAKGTVMLTVKDSDVPGKVSVTVSFKDAKGKPAKVDGVPTWAASDPAIIDSITPSADGLSADIHILDSVGASNLTVNADVDLGSGANNVDFVDTVSVIAGDAVSADFAFSTVTPD